MFRYLHTTLFLLICAGVGTPARAAAPTTQPTKAWLLHLPGIGGTHNVDRAMIRGLHDAGWPGTTEIYDWTENDPGISALQARERNKGEARIVADQLLTEMRREPDAEITLTSHSGGTGIAVWALEQLPPDKKIQTLVLLASALSPGYDLSPALAHVRGHAYVFYSDHDQVVLGVGTTMFGTIDGVRSEAAGLVGFKQPANADAGLYAKLIQIGYDKKWMAFANIGTHIGCMSRSFSAHVIAPILISDLGPSGPTTLPARW